MKTAVSGTSNGAIGGAHAFLKRVIGPFSIRWRVALLVFALLVPMNVLIGGAIAKLASLSRTAERAQLRYSASVIANTVEAQLARYLHVARALSASPALLNDDLEAFRLQASAAFPDISEAWPFVSSAEGDVIMTLQPTASLGRRSPEGMAAQSRAFETHSPSIGGVYRGSITGKWFATVDYPIFRNGKPFRSLTIAMSPEGFFRLLAAQQLPEGWVAAIADAKGSFVARSIANAVYAGQPVAKGWQTTLGRKVVFESVSLEGFRLVGTNEVSPLSGWTIGVAAKESVLEAPVRTTLRWATIIGVAVSLASLLLAVWVAQRIATPILDLERNAPALVGGHPAAHTDGLPEVERVWDALQTAVTERRRFEHDLFLSEELLRTAAEGAHFGVHDYDAASGLMRWTPELSRMLGLDDNARSGITRQTAAAFIHPEDRAGAQAALKEIVKGVHQSYELEFRIRRPDGEVRWVLDRGQAFINPRTGRATRVIGVVIDITERKLGELRQQFLLRELNHRVKNTLAIVQSIAMQTLRGTPDPAHFAQVFTARLMSLARAHNLLSQKAWQGAALGDIVSEAIAPFRSSVGEGAFVIGGQEVEIPANSTVTLALMLHELLSNAAKYGALSVPRGRVKISWEANDSAGGKQLDLCWKEEGGPRVSKPERQGFGSRLLAMSAEQLAGEIALEFEPGGFGCRLRFSLPSAQLPPADPATVNWSYAI